MLSSYLEFTGMRRKQRAGEPFLLATDFVYPTTLLPLVLYSLKRGCSLAVASEKVRGYVRTVQQADLPPEGRTYLPAIRLPRAPEDYWDVLGRLENLSANTQLFGNNPEAYHYLLGELVDNIYEHAQAERAFVMAQFYPTSRTIEVCFLDDGATIPGSLGHGTNTPYPTERHYQAILDAARGRSAKGGGERGYGLSSSIRLITSLGGGALIVSGAGAVVAGADGLSPYSLSDDHHLEGTLVSLRLADSDRRVNFYELIE
ncbi:MAG: hypothetical protein KGJ23_15260 [Euryarchaeota archaeon]|nr:hypothetical protein [Euryarchaeota archaeon]MDE2046526.1 hypothetical protein [Thermoplasmata archaeon]